MSNPTMDAFFNSLRPLVWPKFREEGPPEYVQSLLLGQDLLGTGSELNAHTRSILELVTLGYRPITSLAVLSILNDSPTVSFHGMQIGRELEKRFNVPEGWFTKTRYYTDRVGKLLPLLSKLNIAHEVAKRDPKSGRGFTGYQVHPSVAGLVRERLGNLTRGEPISLFQGPSVAPSTGPVPDTTTVKECHACETVVSSINARYCEKCGQPLEIACQNCRGINDAVYDYCLKCGSRISLVQ